MHTLSFACKHTGLPSLGEFFGGVRGSFPADFVGEAQGEDVFVGEGASVFAVFSFCVCKIYEQTQGFRVMVKCKKYEMIQEFRIEGWVHCQMREETQECRL